MGDPLNDQQCITHILLNSSPSADGSLSFDRNVFDDQGRYKGATICQGELENLIRTKVHNGYTVVSTIMRCAERLGTFLHRDTIDIYIDLQGRSNAATHLINELIEMPLLQHFDRVKIIINYVELPAIKGLSSQFSIRTASIDGLFSEINQLKEWLLHSNSEYLVTLTGDGEYRMRDILLSLQVLADGASAWCTVPVRKAGTSFWILCWPPMPRAV